MRECVCVGNGVGDNYIEVVETGGLLIPNAVTLIKAERGKGGCEQQGSNSIQNRRRRRKNLEIYLVGIQSRDSACNPAKLKKTTFVLGNLLQMHQNTVELTAENEWVLLVVILWQWECVVSSYCEEPQRLCTWILMRWLSGCKEGLQSEGRLPKMH